MRIAYLSRGNTIHDRRFLEKMACRGHDAHFISYYPDKLVEVPGVKTYHFDSGAVAPFPRFRSLQTVRHLRKLLKDIRPDILHSGWLPDHGFFGALSGFHPTLSMAWGSDVLVCTERSRSFAWRIRHALKRSDHIIADAEAVKKRIIDLTRCVPEKVSIFPFGIELDIFRPSAAGAAVRRELGWEDREIIISTRNLRPIYGIESFIESLPRVLKSRPRLGAIVAGSGELEPVLRQRIYDLGLTDHVRLVGALESPRLADYLNAADLYVAVPLSDGTSLSLLEAMACALPVVVSDIPANREWVREGDNGALAAPGDAQDLAQKIIQLLEDTALRRTMGARNLALAQQRADWDQNFSVLEKIYSRLLATRRNEGNASPAPLIT